MANIVAVSDAICGWKMQLLTLNCSVSSTPYGLFQHFPEPTLTPIRCHAVMRLPAVWVLRGPEARREGTELHRLANPHVTKRGQRKPQFSRGKKYEAWTFKGKCTFPVSRSLLGFTIFDIERQKSVDQFTNQLVQTWSSPVFYLFSFRKLGMITSHIFHWPSSLNSRGSFVRRRTPAPH